MPANEDPPDEATLAYRRDCAYMAYLAAAAAYDVAFFAYDDAQVAYLAAVTTIKANR